MKSNKTFLIVALVLILLLAGAAFLYNKLSTTSPALPTPTASQSKEPKEYEQATDFTVYDGDNTPVKLSSLFGKPILLNFWSSRCGPCIAEMPDFEEAYKTYGDDIQFVMVNMTDGYWDTVSTAKSFIKSSGYSFPIYFDTDMDAAITYKIYSIPTTYFINASGEIVSHRIGMIDKAMLKSGIESIR